MKPVAHRRLGADRPVLGHRLRPRRLDRLAVRSDDGVAARRDTALIGAELRDAGEASAWSRIRKARRARVRSPRTLEHAVEGADLVQENGPEDVEAKHRDVRRAGRLAPPRHDPGLVDLRHRCLAFHREARRPRTLPRRPSGQPAASRAGRRTVRRAMDRPGVIARARDDLRSVGQVPITVRREVDGFILNRLQGALLAEAFRLVGEGYVIAAGPRQDDPDGLGLRWSFMGPFETIELNAPGGIPDYCARYTGFYEAPAGVARDTGRVQRRVGDPRSCTQWRSGRDAGAHIAANAMARRAARRARRPQENPTAILRSLKQQHGRRTARSSSPAPSPARSTPRRCRRICRSRRRRSPMPRSARPKPAPRSCICMRAIRRPASPTSRRRRSRPFLKVIKQRSNCVMNITTGGAPTMTVEERVRPARDLQAGSRLAQHGLDEFRPVSDARPLQGVQARLGAALSRRLVRAHLQEHLRGHRDTS